MIAGHIPILLMHIQSYIIKITERNYNNIFILYSSYP